MTDENTIKKAVVDLLSRGLVTIPEASRLSVRSRQIVRHWAKDSMNARKDYLAEQWAIAIERASK